MYDAGHLKQVSLNYSIQSTFRRTLECTNCKNWFHKDCEDIPESAYENEDEDWFCSGCAIWILLKLILEVCYFFTSYEYFENYNVFFLRELHRFSWASWLFIFPKFEPEMILKWFIKLNAFHYVNCALNSFSQQFLTISFDMNKTCNAHYRYYYFTFEISYMLEIMQDSYTFSRYYGNINTGNILGSPMF